MNFKILGAAVAAFAGLASPVLSASLTVTDVDGLWSSSTPDVDGITTPQLRWGTPVGTMQSGYDFVSSPVPFDVLSEEEFVIGTFSHENFLINDTLLEAADLQVTFSLDGVADPIVSTFSFKHTETFNQTAICDDGGANGAGVNASGCADLVTATLNPSQSEVFTIDGVDYILDILGFQKDGAQLTSFWTEEDKSNGADLVAIFTTQLPPSLVPTVPNPAPTPTPTTPTPSPTPVPLPASGLLLLLAMFGLGARRFV